MTGARHRLGGLLMLHAAVLLFGLAGLFGKWLVLSPVLIVLGRTVIAATALAAVVGFLPAARSPFTWSFAINGAVLALHWIAFFAAIQVADVATGLLGFATFPLFVLVIERSVGEIRLTARQWWVALLSTAGIAVMLAGTSPLDPAAVGLTLGVLSAVAFAVLAVLGRRQGKTYHPISIALWQNAWAAIALAPVAWIWMRCVPGTGEMVGPREIALLLVLGVACTAVAHTLFIACLGRVGSPAASVTTTLEPVYGIALACLLLGEVPSARVLAGGSVIIVASALAASGRGTGR